MSIPHPAQLSCSLKRNNGFALLVTVTLVAFLVLVLVSLATLTRVETQVADNSQKLDQARQNALLGLNVALGQLQRYAGPDQRVTATASLGGSTNLDGLAEPTDGKRHWTGVWGNAVSPSTTTASPLLLDWLVSGNETATFSSTSGEPPFSAVSGIAYSPTGAVPSLSAASNALSDLGTTTDPWRLLVGSGSAGSDASRYVAAPLVPVKVAGDVIPGLGSGSGDVAIGRYAWWVGDEGVKADVSLVDPIGTRETDTGRGYSFVAAQRFGIEQVRDASDATVIGDAYPANADDLSKVLVLHQLPLAASDSTSRNTLIQANLARYHDVTASSASVLSDTVSGGLKTDLTAWSEIAGSEGPADADPIVPGTASDYGMPQWGIIRSYAQTTDDQTDKSPVAQTQDTQGVSPVITYARLGFGLALPGANDIPRPSSVTLRVLLFPVVVLWNPTNIPIRGSYEVGIAFRDETPYVPFILAEQFVDSTGVTRLQGHADPYYLVFSAGKDTDGQKITDASKRIFYRFKIENAEIPPGRSLLFALKDADTPYVAGSNVLAPISDGADETNSTYITTDCTANTTIPDTSSWKIKWGRGEGDPYQAKWSSTSGRVTGGLNLVLRPVPATGADELPVQLPEPVDGAYQMIKQCGFNGAQPVGFGASTDPDAFSSSPFLVLSVEMQMAATSSATALPWIKHLNPRALQATQTVWNGTNINQLFLASATDTGIPAYGDGGRLSAGPSVAVTSGSHTDLVLSEFRPADVPLFSIAQLQHADLSLLQFYPAYAVGNAVASPFIPRNATTYSGTVTIHTSSPTITVPFHDLSWDLNRALWDHYYFSTIPTTGANTLSQSDLTSTSYHLPNGRLRFHQPEETTLAAADFKTTRSASTNAARLLVDGGFNVNSTSIDAWRALLAGLNHLAYDPRDPADTGVSLSYPFSRYASPRTDLGTWTSSNQPWGGFRELSSGAIDGLAERIVDEVKKRGPFLSLADFVNRRISSDDTGFAGVIQSALDAQDTDTGMSTADRVNLGISPFDTYLGPTSISSSGPVQAQEAYGGVALAAPRSSRAAFSPGYLTQADILTAIGPSLSARSDTFTVRAYGETVNPATGNITGRAWCEAVVQRLPDYVRPSADSAEVWPPTNTDNQTFGRRFRVVSFRWLTPDEI